MQKSKNELEAADMSWLFFIRIILLIFPVAIIAISLYWIILTSSPIWIKAIGANILISNIFSIIFAIISFALILLCIIGKMTDNIFIPQIFFVSTVLCFVLSFITLSLTTEQSSVKYVSDIIDYCNRNIQTITDSKSICLTTNPEWQISKYVYKRTSKNYDIYVGILAPYVIVFVIFIISCMAFPSNKNHSPAHQQNIQFSSTDDQNDYINMEDDQNALNTNNDTENLINTNNSQQNQPQNNEEKLHLDLPDEYEYVSEDEEDQDDNINITVNQKSQTHPGTNNTNSPTFIKLSDSA